MPRAKHLIIVAILPFVLSLLATVLQIKGVNVGLIFVISIAGILLFAVITRIESFNMPLFKISQKGTTTGVCASASRAADTVSTPDKGTPSKTSPETNSDTGAQEEQNPGRKTHSAAKLFSKRATTRHQP